MQFGVDIRGGAFYEDEYVKVGGEWKIKSTGYKRTYEEMEPRSSAITLTASLWSHVAKLESPRNVATFCHTRTKMSCVRSSASCPPAIRRAREYTRGACVR